MSNLRDEAELRRIIAETARLWEEIRQLKAETRQLKAETRQLDKERWWFSVAAVALQSVVDRLRPKPAASQILVDRFTRVFTENLWLDNETVSGPGSRKDSVSVVAAISALSTVKDLVGFRSLNDIPCGDFNWMGNFLESVPGIRYRGFDIVPQLIAHNKKSYPGYRFDLLDITSASPPRADVIFSKDFFNHLLDEDVIKALVNMKRSRSMYLLASNNFGWANEEAHNSGNYSRYLDLCAAPFNLLPPLWQTDYMGLWKLSDIAS